MPEDVGRKFPKQVRLKSPAQFQVVYDRKKSASDSLLIVYVCENCLPHTRLGVSVSRKVGGAVVRNRYKRLFREAFRLTQERLPLGLDLIMIPRSTPRKPTLVQLQESLHRLAHQAAKKLSPPKRERNEKDPA